MVCYLTTRLLLAKEVGDIVGAESAGALLVVCYYLLKRRCHFQDLGVNYFDQLNQEKLTRYFVKRLTRLGHRVTLEPCSAAA